MIIDGHAHVMRPIEDQLLLMKEAGINKTILFSSSVHPEKSRTKAEFEEELMNLEKILSGKVNPAEARIKAMHELINTLQTHPNDFLGFGSCPAGQSYEETFKWINKYIIGCGLKGIGEIIPGSGQVDKIENIFKVSDDIGNLPLWIHTFSPLNLKDIENIVRLSKKYPKVNVILGHGGGSFWLQTLNLVKEYNNIYMDLSASFTVLSIKIIAQELPDRTLFSSDAPYGNPYLMRRSIEYLIKDQHIRQNILGDNLCSLLGL